MEAFVTFQVQKQVMSDTEADRIVAAIPNCKTTAELDELCGPVDIKYGNELRKLRIEGWSRHDIFFYCNNYQRFVDAYIAREFQLNENAGYPWPANFCWM